MLNELATRPREKFTFNPFRVLASGAIWEEARQATTGEKSETPCSKKLVTLLALFFYQGSFLQLQTHLYWLNHFKSFLEIRINLKVQCNDNSLSS